MPFLPAILVFLTRAPGFVHRDQCVIPKGARPFRPLEPTTYNQFHVLALHVRVGFFLPRGKLVECPASQDLVHLVLGIRMAVRKLEEELAAGVESRLEAERVLPQR